LGSEDDRALAVKNAAVSKIASVPEREDVVGLPQQVAYGLGEDERREQQCDKE
jgi:hypothetical protein